MIQNVMGILPCSTKADSLNLKENPALKYTVSSFSAFHTTDIQEKLFLLQLHGLWWTGHPTPIHMDSTATTHAKYLQGPPSSYYVYLIIHTTDKLSVLIQLRILPVEIPKN